MPIQWKSTPSTTQFQRNESMIYFKFDYITEHRLRMGEYSKITVLEKTLSWIETSIWK